MNSRRRKTLAAVFANPVQSNIKWTAVEGLLLAVGENLIEGRGPRVRFEKGDQVLTFHRPHPATEAKRYQARDAPYIPKTNQSDAMMNAMRFKGYTARIDYDDDDHLFSGHIAGIHDIVGFHSDTVDGFRKAFQEAVEDYLETCARIGKNPRRHILDKSCFESARRFTAELL